MKLTSVQLHTAMKSVSAAIAGAAIIWPHLPQAWQQHVPGWVLGALAVATMVLPSPVIRDPKQGVAVTAPAPQAFDSTTKG